MALQVWMPFTDGTLKQQGLKNVSPTIGGTVDLTSAGKLGKCATIGTVAGGITLPASSMTSFTECSVAFWIKIISWNTSYATFFQAGLGSTPWNNYIFGILRNNANSNLCFTLTNSSGTSSSAAYTTSNLNTGQWYHLAFTYKAGTVSTYIDGVLDKTYSTTYIPNFAGITHISIGRGTNNSGYQTNCNLNDFRIYDHCLSPMEVKELAKGLVLHYPLNRQGWGQENLFTENYWSYGSGWNVKNLINSNVSTTKPIINSDGSCTLTGGGDTTNSQCYCANSGNMVSLESNTTYTISVKITTNGPCNFRMWWYDYDNNGTRLNTYSTNSEIIPSGTTKIFSVTHTTVANTAKCYWELNLYGTPSTSTCLMHAKSLKLEKGSIATPWCPNSSDALATTMGLNSTTEYDCSGFCNNGTKNNITYTSDTPKYSVSSIFNGSNSYIKVNDNNWMVKGMSEMTVNLWAKATTWPTNGGRLVSCTETGGFNLEAGNSGYWRFPIYVYTNSEQTSSAYKYDSKEIKIADLIPNDWNMITLVYDGTGTKTYLNGELHHTYTNTSYGINFNTNARLFLGCEANTASPYAPYFNGMESDFRIYATALSADDVQSLYQNSAYIDSSGNIYGTIHEV